MSCEVAIRELGGHPIYLGAHDIQLARGESLSDTAKALSCFVNAIVVRLYAQDDLESMASASEVPVINALTDLCHPLQILGDLFTIWEAKRRLEGLTLAYVGDGNNICNSLLIGCSKLGINIRMASPLGYGPDERFVKWALANSSESGSSVQVSEDPKEAVKGADVVYTDVFTSMGKEAEHESRLKAFLPRYQVNEELLSHASSGVIFLHNLPCRRGEEVTVAVIDGPRSVVWDQAKNHLYTNKALLHLLLA